MQLTSGRHFGALVIVLALTLIVSPGFAAEKETPQSKLAVVNGSVITQSDFDRQMGRVVQQFRSSGKPLTDSQRLQVKREVLESLIARELLYQESQKKGIQAEAVAVNQQFMVLKKRFPSDADFERALTEMNLSEPAVRAQIEKDLAIKVLIDKQIAQNVAVSEEEKRAYYDGHPGSFKQPEQVRASHILIKVEPQADELRKASARKELEGIKQRLKAGHDFAALAKEFSQGPSSTKGGDLGYFARGQMVKPFEDAAFSLKPGEMSDIVETRFGYHIIKVVDKKPEITISYDEVRERLGQYLKGEKTKREIRMYVKRLEDNANVERFLAESP